jgi:threonine dehydrogenase-like Zn-dependent dehydrogenase
VRFHAPRDVRLEDAPEPTAGPGELVVRVRNCSVCGTDAKIWRSGHPNLRPPRVLGHEVAAASGKAQEDALRMAARRGTVSFFGGLPRDRPTITCDANIIHYREVGIVGANGSSPAHHTAVNLIPCSPTGFSVQGEGEGGDHGPGLRSGFVT